MPIIVRFYGIVIRMHFSGSEHNPPHVHVTYDNETALVDIQSHKVIGGHISKRAERMAMEWISMNETALLHMWETQQLEKLDPLD